MTAPVSTLVFVYGTLKHGGSNHRQLASQTFLGAAHTTPGFRLYDLGAYPGMVPETGDRDGVAGEIWAVDVACLNRLDEFEGVAEKLYRRTPVPLLAPFAGACVETYFYARDCRDARAIAGGVWPVG